MATTYRDARPLNTTQDYLVGARVVKFLLYLVEAFLALRFILRLIGANPGAGFTQFINRGSQPFMQPFLGLVPPTSVGGVVIDWSILIAMLAYWLLAWAIIRLFFLSYPRTRTPDVQ